MPSVKLTKAAISAIPAPSPSGKQILYWDTEMRGFGLLVSGISNSKTFVVQRTINGKSRRVTIAPTNVIGVDEARTRAAMILADFFAGVDPKAKRKAQKAAAITFRMALEAYLTGRKQLRPATVADYRATTERYLSDWLDDALRSITPDAVEQRHERIQKQVAARHAGKEQGKDGKPVVNGFNAANGTFRILRAVWSFTQDSYPDLGPNPVARLKRRWFPERRRDRIVKTADLPAFYRAVCELENLTQRDYLLLVIFSGLRRSEAAGLKWSEIDLDGQIIHIPEERAKGARKLDLPMSDYIHDMLVARRSFGIESDFVFPASSESGHISEPRAGLAIVHEETGIYASVHDLRRLFTTTAEALDISPWAIKGLINHSLGRGVTENYAIVTVERLREPMQRVCDRLKEQCKIVPVEGGKVAKLKR